MGPEPIIPIFGVIKHGSSALLLVVDPVAGVPSPQIFFFVEDPERALAFALAGEPAALVLVAVLVDLDAEPRLVVVVPRARVLAARPPLLALERPVLELLLLLHPVYRRVRPVLLRLRVVAGL